jgi:hypothetical protein
MRLFLSAFALLALSLVAMFGPHAAAKSACLRWADIDTMTRVAPDLLIVKSRTRGDWQIKFKDRCDYQRFADSYFIVRLHDRWECVSKLSILNVNNGAPCFIESVTPLK